MKAFTIRKRLATTATPQKAIAPMKSHPTNMQNPPRHAAWGAFQAGMQILQRYANKSTADPVAIAKANLQLLHQSLLADSAYQETLKAANSATPAGGFPTSHALLATRELQAELITLQEDIVIQLTARQQGIAMLMPITGRASIDLEKDQPPQRHSHWWRCLGQPKLKRSLKNGDVVLVSPGQSKGHILSAKGNSCVLFSVFLPVTANATGDCTHTQKYAG